MASDNQTVEEKQVDALISMDIKHRARIYSLENALREIRRDIGKCADDVVMVCDRITEILGDQDDR